MSAWRIGVESEGSEGGGPPSAGAEDGGGGGGGPNLKDTFDKLAKWIPGDVISFYVAAVSIFTVANSKEPSVPLLIIAIVAAAVLVITGAFATGDVTRKTLLTALFGAVAFAIWSITVPAGGWQRWDFVADNQEGVTLGAAAIGVVFGQIADGILRRV
jgi:hypothetical protein